MQGVEFHRGYATLDGADSTFAKSIVSHAVTGLKGLFVRKNNGFRDQARAVSIDSGRTVVCARRLFVMVGSWFDLRELIRQRLSGT